VSESSWVVDPRLEAALRDVGRRLAYPPTPPLAFAVRVRLTTTPVPAWPWTPWFSSASRRFALGTLATALLVIAGGLLSADVRTAVAERLGLRGINITYVPSMPSAADRPAPQTMRLALGSPMTLDEARTRIARPILVPSLPDLASPDEVYVSDVPAGGQVALLYDPRPGIPASPETGVGLLLTQFDGSLLRGQFGKGLGPGTRLEEVQVNGGYGLRIEGDPHAVFGYQDSAGQNRSEAIRLAANTLIWERGSLIIRLEGALSRDEMLRIAASVR
jgi:hypothetical protein